MDFLKAVDVEEGPFPLTWTLPTFMHQICHDNELKDKSAEFESDE